jgi:hypothetical protein
MTDPLDTDGARRFVHMRWKTLVLVMLAGAAAGCGGDDDGPGRPLGVIGGNEVGSMCAESSDCGDPGAGADCCLGGKCGPDGWCSPRCDTDRDCPDDFVCVDRDGKWCFLTCETDRDCPLDFLCEEKDQRLSCRYKED